MNQFFEFISSHIELLALEFSLSIVAMSYILVIAAEIGDKSQLVCMVLAARYRAAPVALGAIAAFVFLNSLAVTVGITITQLVEPKFISLAVATMFIVFGIQTLRHHDEEEDDEFDSNAFSTKRLLLTTFMLITVAEFGDKTQLAVIGLSSSQLPLSVWIGSTLALVTTTVLGVWLGRTLLQRIPMKLLHQVSGGLFVLLGLAASFKAYQLFQV